MTDHTGEDFNMNGYLARRMSFDMIKSEFYFEIDFDKHFTLLENVYQAEFNKNKKTDVVLVVANSIKILEWYLFD